MPVCRTIIDDPGSNGMFGLPLPFFYCQRGYYPAQTYEWEENWRSNTKGKPKSDRKSSGRKSVRKNSCADKSRAELEENNYAKNWLRIRNIAARPSEKENFPHRGFRGNRNFCPMAIGYIAAKYL